MKIRTTLKFSSPGEGIHSPGLPNTTGFSRWKKIVCPFENPLDRYRDEYSVDTSLKILLVDDGPMNINLFEKMLAKLNIADVHKAYSAAEALTILEEHPVDLIFTDMLMPEVDGLELTERIRSNNKYDAIDIYLVTADVVARISAVESYFSGVLLKPITLKDIKKAVSMKRKTSDK